MTTPTLAEQAAELRKNQSPAFVHFSQEHVAHFHQGWHTNFFGKDPSFVLYKDGTGEFSALNGSETKRLQWKSVSKTEAAVLVNERLGDYQNYLIKLSSAFFVIARENQIQKTSDIYDQLEEAAKKLNLNQEPATQAKIRAIS